MNVHSLSNRPRGPTKVVPQIVIPSEAKSSRNAADEVGEAGLSNPGEFGSARQPKAKLLEAPRGPSTPLALRSG
jgi:hypothetical protein